MKKPACIALILLTTACNEYWWTRGQPPSTLDLIQRASLRFNEAPKTRTDFLPIAEKLKLSLLKSQEAISKKESSSLNALKETEALFIELEGKMSIGSRAAYAELSNQMRSFAEIAESNKAIDSSAYTLFASRSIFFLANELKVPAPTF